MVMTIMLNGIVTLPRLKSLLILFQKFVQLYGKEKISGGQKKWRE